MWYYVAPYTQYIYKHLITTIHTIFLLIVPFDQLRTKTEAMDDSLKLIFLIRLFLNNLHTRTFNGEKKPDSLKQSNFQRRTSYSIFYCESSNETHTQKHDSVRWNNAQKCIFEKRKKKIIQDSERKRENKSNENRLANRLECCYCCCVLDVENCYVQVLSWENFQSIYMYFTANGRWSTRD